MRLIALLVWIWALALPALAGTAGLAFDVHMRGVTVGEVRLSGKIEEARYEFQGFMGSGGLFGGFIDSRYSGAVIGARTAAGALIPQVFRGRFEQSGQFAQIDITYDTETGVSLPQTRTRTPKQADKPHDFPITQAAGAIDPITAIYVLLRSRSDTSLCKQSFSVYDGGRLSRIVLAPAAAPSQKGRPVCNGAYIRQAGFSPAAMAEKRAYPFQLEYEVTGGRYRVVEFTADTVWGKVRATRR